jgi:hypothetical protein
MVAGIEHPVLVPDWDACCDKAVHDRPMSALETYVYLCEVEDSLYLQAVLDEVYAAGFAAGRPPEAGIDRVGSGGGTSVAIYGSAAYR